MRLSILQRWGENMLSKIIGCKFVELGRAAGTVWMGFGDEKGIILSSNNSQRKHIVNDLSLHVECTFRIKDKCNLTC